MYMHKDYWLWEPRPFLRVHNVLVHVRAGISGGILDSHRRQSTIKSENWSRVGHCGSTRCRSPLYIAVAHKVPFPPTSDRKNRTTEHRSLNSLHTNLWHTSACTATYHNYTEYTAILRHEVTTISAFALPRSYQTCSQLSQLSEATSLIKPCLHRVPCGS